MGDLPFAAAQPAALSSAHGNDDRLRFRTRAGKWLLGLGIALGALAIVALVGISLISSDEELALRAAARLEAVLGVVCGGQVISDTSIGC